MQIQTLFIGLVGIGLSLYAIFAAWNDWDEFMDIGSGSRFVWGPRFFIKQFGRGGARRFIVVIGVVTVVAEVVLLYRYFLTDRFANLIFILIALAMGLYCIIAALANWDWFKANARDRGLVDLFGTTGARIFYVLLGALFMVIGAVSLLVS